jgi:hypothetical protein
VKSTKITEVQAQTVNLTTGKPLVDLPSTTVIGSPVQCSPAGTTFLDVYAMENAPSIKDFPDLYTISRLGDVEQRKRNLPAGYEGFVMLSSFAYGDDLVSLIEAHKKKTIDSPASHQLEFFILLSPAQGSSPTAIPLQLKFNPRKIGVLPNGKFLVLGLDEGNQQAVLALLDTDGTFLKPIDLDNREYPKDKGIQKTLNLAPDTNSFEMRRKTIAAVSYSAFVPVGTKVLFVQAASALPIKVLDESGEIAEIKLSIPAGYLLHDLLVSDVKGPLVARLESEADFRSFTEHHVQQNPEETFAEFDRYSGQLLKLIKVKGPQPEEVSCATSNELTAIYFPPEKEASSPSDKKTVDSLIFAKAPF